MENLGTRVAEVLEDRGLEKKGRFQWKATKIRWEAEEQVLQDFVSMHSAEKWGLREPALWPGVVS
jgi:hypothetical protein